MMTVAMALVCIAIVDGTTWAAPPRVSAVSPAPDALINVQPAAITAGFNMALNAADMGANNFALVRSGGDDSFGEGNEVVITGVAPPTMTGANSASLDLTGATMPDDLYAVMLGSAGSPAAGHALGLDGINDSVTMPLLGGGDNPGPTAVVDLTMEAWVYLNANDPLVPMVVIGHGDDYNLGVQNGHAWARIEAGCGNWVEAEGADLLPTGQWIHMAMVYDRVALRVYINGAQVAITPHTILISYCVIEWPVQIGRQDSFDVPGERYLAGVVDEARLWDVARSVPQINIDMYRQLTGAEAGLIGLWDCDEAGGQTLTDKSGTGNDGTLGISGGSDSADPAWLASTAPTGALTNAAGEPLDGEFSGALPSGDGAAGGNFTSYFRLDTTPPRVAGITWLDTTHVDLDFNEPVTVGTAQVPGNYSVNPALTVVAVSLDPNGQTVHLTTGGQAESTLYTVTVSNVEDIAGNAIQAGNGDTGQWNTPGIPPRVTGATMVDWTHVDVAFNEALQQASAEQPTNYAITNGLAVTSATLSGNGQSVRLETSLMSENTPYTVTVSGVRDVHANEIVTGDGDTASWNTGKMASLVWNNHNEFVGRGVDPLRAADTDWFVWKVKYYGGAPTYVRLHVYKSGVEIGGSPFDMKPGQGTPAVGQNFWYKRQLHPGNYSYQFGASDGLTVADGVPTEEHFGPLVGNRPPKLDWTGTEGYDDDGVEPEGRQLPATDFFFRVLYADPEGDAPAFVNCHIAKLIEDKDKALIEDEVHGSPFEMTTTNTDFEQGAVFTMQRQILDDGRYVVWFAAREDVAASFPPQDAYGMPTWWHARKIWVTNLKPQLSWAPGDDFGDGVEPDGIHPNQAPTGTIFNLRVDYADVDSGQPAYVKAHVLRAAGGQLTEIAGSPFDMSPMSEDFTGPVTYTAGVFIGEVGNFRYYFAASDGSQNAIGEPSWHRMRGPTVTGAGTAAVASVACVPAGNGAQISVTLSAAATVSAEVLNIAGRVVKVVTTDRAMSEGVQSLTWDGRNAAGARVPAGVYLVRLSALSDDGGRSQAIATLNLTR
jgi:hypothetical protein